MPWHSFDTDDAKKYGVDQAIILSNLRFWLDHNKANNTNIRDGYVWTFNSSAAFAELFPYWSSNKIQKMLKKMESDGIIITGSFNKRGYDRTKWYTTPDYKIQPNGVMDSADSLKGLSQKAEPIPDGKPDDKPDEEYLSSFDDECEKAFDVFWFAGMKKAGKATALLKFTRHVKKHKLNPQEFAGMLFLDVQKRLNAKQFGFENLHPTTYLNNERWNDEISTAISTPSNQPAADIHAQRQAKLDEWERQMHAAGHGQCQNALGSNGGDLWQQVDAGQRGDATDRPAITLDDSDWQTD